MDKALIDFIERVNAATTFDDAWTTTVAFFTDHAQPIVGYLCVAPNGRGGAPEVVVFRNSVEHTLGPMNERYVGEGVYRDDPLVKHQMTALTPVYSGLDFVGPEHGDTVRRILEALREETGGRTCVHFPVRDPVARTLGGIAVGGALRRGEFVRAMRDQGETLWLAALYADARMASLRRIEEGLAVGLSPRERECLLWLARGLKHEAIAERLGLRRVTIDLHLANARRKLRVATREQALVKAVMLGLVEP